MITKEQLQAQIEVTPNKPVKGVILVLKQLPKDKLESGLYIPEEVSKKEAQSAKNLYVLAVHESQTDIKPTDIIFANQYAPEDAIESVVPGYEVGIIREHNIFHYKPFV